MSISTKSTIKMKNSTFAIPADAADMPVNPNTPAMMAITKKINAQRNIYYSLV